MLYNTNYKKSDSPLPSLFILALNFLLWFDNSDTEIKSLKP